MSLQENPFPTVMKLANECGEAWPAFRIAAQETASVESRLRDVLIQIDGRDRLLTADASLVLCGSFARHEMHLESDCDWTLLVDGVVSNKHAQIARNIHESLKQAEFRLPGTSETFGNMTFSHDLVHKIGGGADSNANLTRRMLMLLESRPLSLSSVDSSAPVWENVIGNILQRYFEEDVHFAPGKGCVPRFLLNDLTRYWRTICVDYAAKHREQSGKKWAIRNAKLRFSRKLLYVSGLAFCLSCQLDPPTAVQSELFDPTSGPAADQFISKARSFARTPSLEYIAAFISTFVTDNKKRAEIARLIFGTYDWWLSHISQPSVKKALEELSPSQAAADSSFQAVRDNAANFAKGLELLIFNKTHQDEVDKIASLTYQYIGFRMLNERFGFSTGCFGKR